MKVAIAILVAFLSLASAAVAQDGKALFKNCPDFKLVYNEFKDKITLNHVLGPWNVIRKGPVPDSVRSKFEGKDCLKKVFYQDDTTDPNSVKFLYHCRKDGKHTVKGGMKTLDGLENGKVDNHFEFKGSFKNEEKKEFEVSLETALVDTDKGETWGLWASCVHDGTKKAVVWTIVSRYPWIDAKLEQTLVERIEKYGGVTSAQLRGIGQSDCYKEKKKEAS